jgi:hypothetical protein
MVDTRDTRRYLSACCFTRSFLIVIFFTDYLTQPREPSRGFSSLYISWGNACDPSYFFFFMGDTVLIVGFFVFKG